MMTGKKIIMEITSKSNGNHNGYYYIVNLV